MLFALLFALKRLQLLTLNTEFLSTPRFFVSPSNCHVKNLDVCYSVRGEGSQDTTTPLIEAALSNNEKVVTDLLKHGASVNFPKVIYRQCSDTSIFWAYSPMKETDLSKIPSFIINFLKLLDLMLNFRHAYYFGVSNLRITHPFCG